MAYSVAENVITMGSNEERKLSRVFHQNGWHPNFKQGDVKETTLRGYNYQWVFNCPTTQAVVEAILETDFRKVKAKGFITKIK